MSPLMSVFGRIERRERLVVALMFMTVFIILCAYYVLKTVREGLILTGGMAGLGGEEIHEREQAALDEISALLG